MSPKYWVSSEDLSADSSFEDGAEASRDSVTLAPGGEQKEGFELSAEEEINFLERDSETEANSGEKVMPSRGLHHQKEDHEVSGTCGYRSDRSRSQEANVGTVARTGVPGLPSLQPHQHASLLYLSLIEGRCRTQATNAINAGRKAENKVTEDHPEVLSLAKYIFQNMQGELVKAGMIPADFAPPNLIELRRYLTSFDSLVTNLATQRTTTFNIPATEQHSLPALPGFQSPSFNPNLALVAPHTSLFTYDHRYQQYTMPPKIVQPPEDQPSRLSSLLPGTRNTLKYSEFDADYVILGTLGKGGFGEVFKAQYKLDGGEYAIKKIVLRASYLNQLYKEQKLHKLSTEVKTLARLDHPHIVRYHHCWLENGQGTTSADEDGSKSSSLCIDEDQTKSRSKSKLVSTDTHDNGLEDSVSGIETIHFDIERDLDEHFPQGRANTTTSDGDTESSHNFIVFGEDSKSKLSSGNHSALGEQSSTREPSGMSGRPSEDSSHRGHGESSTGSETADEEFSRAETPRQEIATATTVEVEIKEDAILFIKMTAYPLTLFEYMRHAERKSEKDAAIKHCFHEHAAVRILLGILDGLEYLHRKGIYHRDMKPQNVFLSVLDSSEKPTHGYIDTQRCNRCRYDNDKKQMFISPRIGDFGLVYVKEQDSDTASVNNSSSLASSNPGTFFYTPPHVAGVPMVVCEKIDVFALGIIAAELVLPFKLNSERIQVLTKIKVEGVFPSEYKNEEMKYGIGNMIAKRREDRWECAEVRNWLEGLLEKFENGKDRRRSDVRTLTL